VPVREVILHPSGSELAEVLRTSDQ
jgi:hypothetical protein